MTTATKRTRAVPRPAPSPLPTLEDYGLTARGERPGESWVKCCEQERAYTLGWRMALKVGSPQACPLPDDLEPHWRMGHADGWRKTTRRTRVLLSNAIAHWIGGLKQPTPGPAPAGRGASA